MVRPDTMHTYMEKDDDDGNNVDHVVDDDDQRDKELKS